LLFAAKVLSPRANFGRGLAWLGRHPSTKACPRAHARARCRKSRYTSAMVAAKQRGRISAGRSLHQTGPCHQYACVVGAIYDPY
jgi:hypothetical protein